MRSFGSVVLSETTFLSSFVGHSWLVPWLSRFVFLRSVPHGSRCRPLEAPFLLFYPERYVRNELLRCSHLLQTKKMSLLPGNTDTVSPMVLGSTSSPYNNNNMFIILILLLLFATGINNFLCLYQIKRAWEMWTMVCVVRYALETNV